MENLLREVFPNTEFSPSAIKLLQPLYECVINSDWTERKIRHVFPGNIGTILISNLDKTLFCPNQRFDKNFVFDQIRDLIMLEKRDYGIEIFISITKMLIRKNRYITGKQILNRIENDEELYEFYKYVLRVDIDNYVIKLHQD